MSKNYFNEVAIKEEFHIAFAVSKKIIFKVSYYTLGNNLYPYFTTQACEFNYTRSDWKNAGQAQERLLTGKAKEFWKRWDVYHLKNLNDETYFKLRKELEELIKVYPCYLKVIEDTERRVDAISFCDLQTLSRGYV